MPVEYKIYPTIINGMDPTIIRLKSLLLFLKSNILNLEPEYVNLSMTVTSFPVSRAFFTKWLPIKPAPPVTNNFLIIYSLKISLTILL